MTSLQEQKKMNYQRFVRTPYLYNLREKLWKNNGLRFMTIPLKAKWPCNHMYNDTQHPHPEAVKRDLLL